MKKVFYLFLIALSIVSCVGPIGPMGPEGPKGEDGYSTNFKIIDFQVKSADWVLQKDNSFSYHFNTPEISSFIFNEGVIVVYSDFGTSQQALPVVRHLSNGTQFWTQTTDCEFQVGGIDFYVTNSDFVAERPNDLKFRLVLMW